MVSCRHLRNGSNHSNVRRSRGKVSVLPAHQLHRIADKGQQHFLRGAIKVARHATDEPTALILEVDGERVEGLEQYRQHSPGCLTRPSRPGRVLAPSAADGYVMLEPLKRGTHTINFGGTLPDIESGGDAERAVRLLPGKSQRPSRNAGTGRPAAFSQAAMAPETVLTAARCVMRSRHARSPGVEAVIGAPWRSPNRAAM